jgi:hypothetical protein
MIFSMTRSNSTEVEGYARNAAGQCLPWVNTEVAALRREVRFDPINGHRQNRTACPFRANKRKSRIIVDLAREQRQQLMPGSVKIAGAGVRFCPHDQIERRQAQSRCATWTNGRPRHRERIAARSIVGAQTTLFQLESHLVEADNQEIT